MHSPDAALMLVIELCEKLAEVGDGLRLGLVEGEPGCLTAGAATGDPQCECAGDGSAQEPPTPYA